MAQFDNSNSVVRKTLLEYELGSDGFYRKKEGTLIDRVDGVVSMYAFDKKSSNLYVQTETGNFVVVLNKDHAKKIKRPAFIKDTPKTKKSAQKSKAKKSK